MKTKITRDRRVQKGYDLGKLVKIWKALAENNDYLLHVAEISRITGINECTVRLYLNKYLKDAIIDQEILPNVKLRVVRLKPGMDLASYLKALKLIKGVKKDGV